MYVPRNQWHVGKMELQWLKLVMRQMFVYLSLSRIVLTVLFSLLETVAGWALWSVGDGVCQCVLATSTKLLRSDSWRGTLELDGGALMNQASHYIDLLDWLVGLSIV